MKIITWNCKMRFRDDIERICQLKPDLLIIPESEKIDRIDSKKLNSNGVSDTFWIGDNPNKGLAIFTFNNFKINIYEKYSEKFKYILPVTISKDSISYRVIAVWTKKVGKVIYTHQLKSALREYDNFLDFENIIVCGDFNSNLIWERSGVDSNHQDILDILSNKKIYSSYHSYFKEEQGKELKPTYYHYHKKDRPFHIDFCFLSSSLLTKVKNIKIFKYEEWITSSDHVPIMVDIN